MELKREDVERVVGAALAEDVERGDATSEAVLDPDVRCRARLVIKEPGVVAGLPAVEAVFLRLDPRSRFEALVADGHRVEDPPEPVARVEGEARALLAAERTALNLLGRLSGIATLTRRFVDAVEGTGAAILDTRKTTPGLRALEKYAVRCGGGRNHRFGLDDAILIKDNHVKLAGGVRPALERALAHRRNGRSVEIEADTLADVREALAAGAGRILLDNMSAAEIAEAVALAAGRAELEASGGVTLATVRELAETGVDAVSVGALTHSAPGLDVALDLRAGPEAAQVAEAAGGEGRA
jgi:nicotinate-nucleotide pyrophosphorylase (carboxylating)